MSTYEELIALRERLEKRVENLSSQLNEAKIQLNSVVTTLGLLGHKNLVTETEESRDEYIFPPHQLKGLTHHEALEKIARANGNRFKLTDAKKVLVAAGLITTPKNAYSILSNTIGRVGKFRKIGPGEFELPTNNKEETPLIAEAATHK